MAALLWLAAIAMLPWMVSPAELRLAVEKAITGDGRRAALLQGDPELKLLPSPRLVLHDVRLPVDELQSVHTSTVVSRLDLWYLLLGRVEIADIILERPVLVLSGKVKAAELLVPLLAQLSSGPSIKVVDGVIAWRAANGYTRPILSHVNGRMEHTLGGGLSLSSVFEWREAMVEAALTIDDLAAFQNGAASTVRTRISGEGAVMRFRGLAGYDGSLSARGELSADADSLRKVVAWMGASVPAQNGFGPAGLTSQLVLEQGELSLTGTRLNLDGNKVDGGFLVSMSGAKPKVQGTVAADELNLRHYGRIQLTVNDGQEWNPEPINLNLLDTFDLDLRFSAGQVSAGTATFTTLAGSAVLSNGKLVLAIGQTKGWGGTLRGAATLSPQWSGALQNQRGVSVRVEAECTDILLEQALNDLADLNRFEGTGTLSFLLEGEGRSIAAVAQGLSGAVDLSSKGGYLRGFDVARVLRRIERSPLSGGADPHGGRTPFQTLEVKAAISNGVAALNRMELNGEQVELSIIGKIAVKNRSLDLHGQAALLPTGEKTQIGEIELPFMIVGAWNAPRIMADPLSLIERSGAAQPLLEAVKDQRERDAARPLVEHLIGPVLSTPGIAEPTGIPAQATGTP